LEVRFYLKIFEDKQFFMTHNKLFILLPDGVGLRNFAYTDFYAIGKEKGYAITYWNATPFSLHSLGFTEIHLQGKVHPKTDLLKRAKTAIELKSFEKQTSNPIYAAYRFASESKTWKQKIKNLLVRYYTIKYKNKRTILAVKMQQSERNTDYYKLCLATLKKERPTMVFCTSQRPVNAIAPLTAAKDLGIPTATFIFSWDNLPKATMVVETDYYFVWSEQMRNELLYYYPNIKDNQIVITGTPQFEMHFNKNLLQTRDAFCAENHLDVTKKYVCFSGDDITTSPLDQVYLEDIAKTIRELNTEQRQWGILFRRCPVDFSDRFNKVLADYKDEITVLSPKWERKGASWNTVLPTKEDNPLLLNTLAHSELILNVGSSMVFDGICHDTPCAYIRYNPKQEMIKKDIYTVYQYIHFKSMPKQAPVFWVDSPEQIKEIMLHVATEGPTVLPHAKNWFKTINHHPPQKASERIWEAIEKIIH